MRLPPRARSGRGGPGARISCQRGLAFEWLYLASEMHWDPHHVQTLHSRGDTDTRLNQGIRTPPGAWLQMDVDVSLEEVPEPHSFPATHRVLPSVTGGGFWRRCDCWVRSGRWGNKCHGFVVLQSQTPSWEGTNDMHRLIGQTSHCGWLNCHGYITHFSVWGTSASCVCPPS
ncbi:hypothetical protein KIL84_002270 [Mauremys mutica]|uniref:Uncharacterized protein n=1 Tax=Mauremys mutica TaxID=74926 RepID=A0A9D3X6G4_9SAUR|nr:hypothetical protein KIL84_002270 [Mauremys mutica]